MFQDRSVENIFRFVPAASNGSPMDNPTLIIGLHETPIGSARYESGTTPCLQDLNGSKDVSCRAFHFVMGGFGPPHEGCEL